MRRAFGSDQIVTVFQKALGEEESNLGVGGGSGLMNTVDTMDTVDGVDRVDPSGLCLGSGG
jgi:hypothetical protein